MTMGADGKLTLANGAEIQAKLIVWIFAMRVPDGLHVDRLVLDQQRHLQAMYAQEGHFDFEAPLTSLIWITSIVSHRRTFVV